MRLGLIMRAVGDTMIISPPLVMSRKEIDELIVLATSALDKTLAAMVGKNDSRGAIS
jgi:putrescine aminotransferase